MKSIEDIMCSYANADIDRQMASSIIIDFLAGEVQPRIEYWCNTEEEALPSESIDFAKNITNSVVLKGKGGCFCSLEDFVKVAKEIGVTVNYDTINVLSYPS